MPDRLRLAFIPNSLEQKLINAIPYVGPRSRHPAFNAVYHLHQATRLRDIDSEMAALRSITAQEESAAALFHALKRRRYPRAEQLDLRSHTQKLALDPFLIAFKRMAAQAGFSELNLRFHMTERPTRGHLEGHFTDPRTGEGFHFDPPLEFKAALSAPTRSLPTLTAVYVAKAFGASSLRGLFAALRARAQMRTKLLYAGKQGSYRVPTLTDEELARSRRVVMRDLKLLFLIEPYPRVQSLPAQLLDCFLTVLEQAPEDLGV